MDKTKKVTDFELTICEKCYSDSRNYCQQNKESREIPENYPEECQEFKKLLRSLYE